jgi:2-keto-3-deoxy-L-arabinonate dehydratase
MVADSRSMLARPYRGVFPVVPTIFHDDGSLDLDGQKRAIDFMIDAGSNGLCILANYSEQFVLSDAEREILTDVALKHVAGRVPVIVTTTHYSTAICVERCRKAEALGAAMVMIMPPYHGATIRVGEAGVYEFFKTVSDAITIPIMIQDAPVSGTPLSGEFLARMAQEIKNVSYFKIETAGAAAKLRALIAAGGAGVEGPWDGEEGITLMADLDAGATGSMTGGGYPDGFRQILDPWFAGDRAKARAAYAHWLPLINWENRQCGLAAAKILMQEGGIIGSDRLRLPQRPVDAEARKGLLELARERDVVALRWGR